jgi:uncharacterized protein (DUF433 family)
MRMGKRGNDSGILRDDDNAKSQTNVKTTYDVFKIMKYGAINIDPETLGGTPVFTGTRVPIQSLFDYIESGETLEEFLENFPTVTAVQAIEVLEKAKTSITSEKILHENFA